jgi:chaperonin GroES
MIIPINNRVVVKRCKEEEKTASGLIIPDSSKKRQETAIVVAVPESPLDKDGNPKSYLFKVGDKILLERYTGQEITIDDEELVITKADDIVAIIS